MLSISVDSLTVREFIGFNLENNPDKSSCKTGNFDTVSAVSEIEEDCGN